MSQTTESGATQSRIKRPWTASMGSAMGLRTLRLLPAEMHASKTPSSVLLLRRR